MADSEIAGLTEDTTPDSTDNVYAQDAAGAVDKRVPLSALPVSTATQTALDLKAPLASPTFTGTVTVPNDSFSLAKLVNIATSRILGRVTAASGDIEELTAAQVRTLINVEDGATADQTAAEILAALLTVDGAGSGLDADLLDGQSSAAFATAAQGATADAAIPKATADANSVLYAVTDNTPAALAMGASTILARLATGDIVAATPAQLRTLLGLVIGTDVQAFDADLSDLAAIADAQGDIIVRGASGWERLAKSATATDVLTAGSTQPTWGAAGTGTAIIGDWSALGNLGATETVTGVDNTIVRSAGTLDQACTVTISTTADQLIDLYLTQDVTGGRGVTWAGVDVWHTQTGVAPVLTAQPAGTVDRFFFEDIAGTCHGYWWTEPVVEVWTYAIGDETTAITTGTAKITFRAPYAFTLVDVRASLTTASSSGIPTFDINEGGTTLLSTKLTIDANEKTSTTAATAAVISDNVVADDAEMTIDVDVAGTGAAGAKISLYVRRR